jgi:hypothetical protein
MVYKPLIKPSVHKNNTNYCSYTVSIDEDIITPALIYYQLDNFFLNHRYLVKSKIWAQLRGEVHVDSSNNNRCTGAIYMNEMFDNDTSKYFSYTGKPIAGNAFANPCGLIAKSFFRGKQILT